MNPLIHAELSWLTAQPLRERRDRVLVMVSGIAPDLDGLTILGGLDAYGKYHHVLFHGYVGALVTVTVLTALARDRARVALLALLGFHLHVLCDLAGSGPGWPIHYWWPQSMSEWFWDGQWDLASWQNSVIGLAVTLASLATAFVFRRTFVEVFSPRWDAVVVATLRHRFLGEPMPDREK